MNIHTLQDLKRTAIMMEVEAIASLPFPFLHPESIDILDTVHLFEAVVGKKKELIKCGDFISYYDGSGVGASSLSIHNRSSVKSSLL